MVGAKGMYAIPAILTIMLHIMKLPARRECRRCYDDIRSIHGDGAYNKPASIA